MTNLKRKWNLKMMGGVTLSLFLMLSIFAMPAFTVENAKPAATAAYNTSQILVQAESFEDAQRVAGENNMTIIKSFDAINEIMGTWYGVYEVPKTYGASIAEAVATLKDTTDLLHAGHDYMLSPKKFAPKVSRYLSICKGVENRMRMSHPVTV